MVSAGESSASSNPDDAARAWKQRLQVKDGSGGAAQAGTERISARHCLTVVRAFYLDIAQWALDDPSRWARWAVPCPVRPQEITSRKTAQHRKSRMDARTRERLPLLQVTPSKTDAERLLLISPELADVLAAVISRLRGPSGAIPLAARYDRHERRWMPPAPLLFQRRFRGYDQALQEPTLRDMLAAAITRAGIAGPATGQPLSYTPHDFRRIFITDAVLNGLPPHIAQVIAGHRDINVTMGYKAVYPHEAIQAHLAHLTRRRAQRPSEEYRAPTDAEWQQFLGHFERRKVATGTCGRAFATPCPHEHACIRCPMLWPDPAQQHRLTEIRDNLTARITEAEREGWHGEIEGLRISLAGAEDKLTQISHRTSRTTDLGIPAIPTR